MHYQVLARKWRPQKFDELIGQPHIVQTLKNSLLQKRIAQAYLLAGTRGVGKTTVARIFAKSIRCMDLQENADPCGKCEACLENGSQSSMDIIEIDGASHNGVESIRTLIDNVQYLPTSGSYKVYIIDEVHMLSVSAFNALLKTLEEPPAHVIFIFATTDPDKLLKTVLSRCQRLDFRNVQEIDLSHHIESIAQKENISFENKALIKDLCSLGKGSVRDTLSLLDQLLSMSEDRYISEEVFSLALGVAKDSDVEKTIELIVNEKALELKDFYFEIFKNNIDLKAFCSQVSHKFFELTQDTSKRDSLGVALDESFWLYEVFNKELGWVFDSLSPLEIVLTIFQKMALRKEFFASHEKKKSIAPTDQEKVVETAVAENTVAKNEEVEIVKKDFVWKEFLKFIEPLSLAIAQNLRRAFHTNSDQDVYEAQSIEISYVEGDEVLYNFIGDSSSREKLKKFLSDYLQCQEALSWNFQFKIISKTEKASLGVISVEEEIENEIARVKEQKRQNVQNNQYVLEAQKLFDTQVDKIIIKE